MSLVADADVNETYAYNATERNLQYNVLKGHMINELASKLDAQAARVLMVDNDKMSKSLEDFKKLRQTVAVRRGFTET